MSILFVLHGSGVLNAQETQFQLHPGCVLTVRPGVIHSFEQCDALQLVECSFLSRTFRESVGRAIDPQGQSVLLQGTPVCRYEMPMHRFRTVASLLNASPDIGETGNFGRMLLVVEAISRHASPLPHPVHPAVFKAIQAFDESLTRDWSLAEISDHIRLDPSYLARLFTSLLGVPPLAYLAMSRSEEAADLLLTTHLSCAAVGERVGWRDPNYFSRRFRQHFGKSPSSYQLAFRISPPGHES